MIKFHCTNCDRKIGVPEEYALKRIKCPKCGRAINAPETSEAEKEDYGLIVLPDAPDSQQELSELAQISQPNYSSSHPSAETPAESSILPKWLWGIVIPIGVLFVGLLLYAFVLRDTWETDNWDKISEYQAEASQLIATGQVKQGLDTYEELFAFVGDRKLKIETLQQILDESQNEYDKTKQKWNSVYVPLMEKRDDAQKLFQNLQIHESISLCQKTLKAHEKFDGKNVLLKKLLLEVEQLEKQSEGKLKQLIAQDNITLLPKLMELYKEADALNQQGKVKETFYCLHKIVKMEEEKIWSPDVIEFLAKVKPVYNEAKALVDEQRKIAEAAEKRREELERQAGSRRREEERQRAAIEANTFIVICPACLGTGEPTPEDMQKWRDQVSAISAQGSGVRRGPRMPTKCSVCGGCGKLKEIYGEYYRINEP